MKTRLAVLISGTGSNMQSIASACEQADFPAEIALVLSNKSKAPGLAFANQKGIRTAIVPHGKFEDRQTFEQAIHQELCTAKVELICLAGFMRILSTFLVSRWDGKMLNVHPSLLPSLRGLNTHQRALDAGLRVHGCTVHQVSTELDDGPILGQAAISVQSSDTAETLQKRVLRVEHQLYPAVIARACFHLQGISAPQDKPDQPINTIFSLQ
ncbi:MAG: phosphoribosylglycinamide formyltransferase [Robiginitomaculum sp.]|nr:MAG: phosphoribosylglycinamide formyltransferase [Robiginitomaculum sp.]